MSVDRCAHTIHMIGRPWNHSKGGPWNPPPWFEQRYAQTKVCKVRVRRSPADEAVVRSACGRARRRHRRRCPRITDIRLPRRPRRHATHPSPPPPPVPRHVVRVRFSAPSASYAGHRDARKAATVANGPRRRPRRSPAAAPSAAAARTPARPGRRAVPAAAATPRTRGDASTRAAKQSSAATGSPA